MSKQSQIRNMKALAQLLSQPLGYIYGERECGPNGAKKQFLSKGRAFLSALAKDLGLTDYTVRTNPAGIAVSGEATLSGTWPTGRDIYVSIQQMDPELVLLYRREMGSGQLTVNHFVNLRTLEKGDYDALLDQLRFLNKEAWDGHSAA